MKKFVVFGIIIAIIIFVAVALFFGIKAVVNNNNNNNQNLQPPDIWLSNVYKTLQWENAPLSDDGGVVSQDWINWAKTAENSLLQYYVNYRRTSQKMLDTWPTTDDAIILNPVYSWDGFTTAVYIWNKAVELNNNSSKKPLGQNLSGFCNEDDELKRKMTLAAFLGNAVVESAYFLVCKESTTLVDGTNCPGGNVGDPTFNPRYLNNCDNANPMTYSCEGNAGGSGGGTVGGCFPKSSDKDTVCNTPGCFTTKENHFTCNASQNGAQFVSWDDSTVKSENNCDAQKLSTKDETYKFAYWCPAQTPAPTPPTPTKPFNPTTDACTGGWPVCQFPGQDGNFISLPPSDPCMTDPYADGSMKSPLNNNNPTCSDWNGNPWKQQQECYFGRGLIQLTWSCNYYQAQRFLRLMADIIPDSNDAILTAFKNAINKPLSDPGNVNLCANPDGLCGNYTLQKDAKVVYSKDLIQRTMPWLSCVIYWATKCAPTYNKCYAFGASYNGIAPSGAGNRDVRLKATKFMMGLMGENINDSNKFINTENDLKLNLQNCDSDPSGGGGGGGGLKCGDGKDWTYNQCKNKNCSDDSDCPAGLKCYSAAGIC